MAQKAGKIWREHGALDYKECAGDDLNVKMGVPFTKQTAKIARCAFAIMGALAQVEVPIDPGSKLKA
jgi:hypothetical protein